MFKWNSKVFVTQDISSDTIIALDSIDGEYYAVDGLYAVVVKLIQHVCDFEELKELIYDQYEVDELSDIKEIIHDLQERGWLLDE